MKTFLIIFLSISFSLFALEEYTIHSPIKDPKELVATEIARLDTLIQATSSSLEGQKNLREKIVEYKKIQDEYLQHTNDNDLLLKLVKASFKILKLIKENHLESCFDPEFIEELTILSQPASKKGIPRP